MSEQLIRPKIGLALSGASSRAIYYIGFLEVLAEYDIPVDYIAASSSGTIIAMAYACGTLPQLREHVLRFDTKDLFRLFGKASFRGKGLYSLDAVEELFRFYSRGLSFEEVRPLMSFMAVDIEGGQKVALSMGDLARAARISCTLPGMFEPIDWGGKTLVDGGLLDVVPIEEVKGSGADITIALDIPGIEYIFSPTFLTIRKAVNLAKKIMLLSKARILWRKAYTALAESTYGDFMQLELPFEEPRQFNSLWSVLGRSLDLSISANSKPYYVELNSHTDFFISPLVPKGRLSALEQNQYTYELGRKTAEQLVPRFKDALTRFEELQAQSEVLKIRLQ